LFGIWLMLLGAVPRLFFCWPGIRWVPNPPDFPHITNTESQGNIPAPTPPEDVKLITRPPGPGASTHGRVFAGETRRARPISMCFDDRGPLWGGRVSYTYAGPNGWDSNTATPLVVFEEHL